MEEAPSNTTLMNFYQKYVSTSTPVVRRGDANEYVIKEKLEQVKEYPHGYEEYFKTIFEDRSLDFTMLVRKDKSNATFA